MQPSHSPGFDIGPDIDRRGMHGAPFAALGGRPGVGNHNVSFHHSHSLQQNPQSNSSHSLDSMVSSSSAPAVLASDDLEEDSPSMEYITQRFPEGNIIGLPGVFARPVYEPIDESTTSHWPDWQLSNGHSAVYQNGLHLSDATMDDMARGSSPFVREDVRLRTFEKWPHVSAPRSVRPEDLARDGFRYLGPGDRVQCVFCRQILKQWEEGDTPRGEHVKHSPQCPLLQGQARQNVPLDRHAQPASLVSQVAGDEVHDTYQVQQCDSLVESPRPVYPQFSVEATRLATFGNWPSQMNQKPEDLSNAGLFYLNEGDKVCCYYCGEQLCSWEPEDDPWVEHARNMPHCYFVKMVKGENFIQMAQKGLVQDVSRESESVENLLGKPAALALIHDGFSREQISVALSRMIQRHAGQEVYHAKAIKEELEKIGKEKAKVLQEGAKSENAAKSHTMEQQPDREVGDLEEENRQLREQRICKVCLENEITMIFLPCGHLVCCAACGLALSECPICRQHITKTTKAYWA